MKTLVFDSSACTGARACERTCAQTWHHRSDAAWASIRISGDAGGHGARFCIQCGLCVEVCPTNALVQAKDGVVHVRRSLCVGCLSCIGFCPYSVMFHDRNTALPFKCIACGQCVKACPSGALSIGEVDEATTDVWHLAPTNRADRGLGDRDEGRA